MGESMPHSVPPCRVLSILVTPNLLFRGLLNYKSYSVITYVEPFMEKYYPIKFRDDVILIIINSLFLSLRLNYNRFTLGKVSEHFQSYTIICIF